jgi:rod shape-determining protein MreC
VIDDIGVVGQVTRVFPFTSEVTLLTDKEQAIPVQVVRTGLRSVVYGQGHSGSLDLRFMPVNADIKNGDVLVTSGIDGIYPAGLAVAKVVQVESKSSDAFARIICLPIAGVDRNRQLLVLLTEQNLAPRPEPENPKEKGKAAKRPAEAGKEQAPADTAKEAAKPAAGQNTAVPAAAPAPAAPAAASAAAKQTAPEQKTAAPAAQAPQGAMPAKPANGNVQQAAGPAAGRTAPNQAAPAATPPNRPAAAAPANAPTGAAASAAAAAVPKAVPAPAGAGANTANTNTNTNPTAPTPGAQPKTDAPAQKATP